MGTEGKRVLITGASGGLGTATMTALLAKGCKVVGIDRRSAASADRDVIVADLADEAQAEQAVKAAISRLGGLDVLINNAGILDLQDPGEIPSAGAREHMEVNFLSPWRVTALALPSLIESRGRVINVCSLFAVVSSVFHPAYCASKRALAAYSDVLRIQYGDRITVTSVYPGYMPTKIHERVKRQGWSLAALVKIRTRRLTFVSLEEPLDVAARSMVRACFDRPARDRCLTLHGTFSFFMARHVPALVDRFIHWRINHLVRGGMRIQLRQLE